MSKLFASLVAGLFALSLNAFAADAAKPAADAKAAEALAQKSGCLACHSVQNKVVGPAYKDVAAKYKANKVERDRKSVV